MSHVKDVPLLVAEGLGGASDAGVAGVRTLGGVPDPRKPRGVRHRIGAVLAVTVFAVLAGTCNFRVAGDWAADLPQELLAFGRVPPSRADRALPRAQRAHDPSDSA